LKIAPLGGIVSAQPASLERAMNIIWTIIIGFVAGVIAKFVYGMVNPGGGARYEPKGFIWTVVIAIVGALIAEYFWSGAGLISAICGAIVLLVIWGFIAPRLENRT
jgi:uncharacterized membrane protein YeaQ/YmgE (transglycosylase-associated protein family)